MYERARLWIVQQRRTRLYRQLNELIALSYDMTIFEYDQRRPEIEEDMRRLQRHIYFTEKRIAELEGETYDGEDPT